MKLPSLKKIISRFKSSAQHCILKCRNVYRGVKLRTIERRRSAHHKKLTPPYTHCKNCGHELRGMYCHACGQFAREINPSIFNFVWQYFENAFQVDGKFWLTVRRLFAYPGRLSSEFMAGHVRRYVFPLKLYMMVAVAFSFIVLGVRSSIEEENGAKIEKTGNLATLTTKPVTDSTQTATRSATIDADSTLTADQKKAQKEKISQPDKVDWADSGINFATRLPIAMMFAMPLFALIARGFYRRRYSKYLPHLIFSIHLHTVFFITLSLILLLDNSGENSFIAWSIVAMLLWVMWYGYIATIRFYGDPWLKVLVKNFFLYTLYYIFCLVIIVLAFFINVCYDSWASGNHFLEPIYRFIE